MRICPNCGVPNPDGNKCCESCGADMISGNSTGNSSDKSHSEQQEVKNSGLIGTMGNTRHVTDPERKETGDVQKHVSGFGLVGSMGNVHYDGDQLEKEEHSKSGEKGDGARETGIDKAYLSTVDDAAKPENPKPVKGRLVESIGERKYETDTKAEEASPPKTSKMMGKMGDTEYRYAPDESKESDKSKPLESGAKLIGSVGERKYKTDAKAENSAKKTSKITGRMGDTEYHYESDISKTPDESKPSEIKGKLYGNIGTASYIFDEKTKDDISSEKSAGGSTHSTVTERTYDIKGRIGDREYIPYDMGSSVKSPKTPPPSGPHRRKPPFKYTIAAILGMVSIIVLLVLLLPHFNEKGSADILTKDTPGMPDNYYAPVNEELVREENGIKYIPGQFVVVSSVGTSYESMKELFSSHDMEIIGYVGLMDTYQVRLNKSVTLSEMEQLRKVLLADSRVETATVDAVWEVEAESLPADPWSDNRSNTPRWDNDSGSNWGVKAINAPYCWENYDLGEVKVGIIDSMFDENHEDLSAQISGCYYNSIFDSYVPRDKNDSNKEHGTHVAGIIGATHNNGYGLSGILEDASIYAYSIRGFIGNMNQISAIGELSQREARVINYSMGYIEEIVYDAVNGKHYTIDTYYRQNAEVTSAALSRLLQKGGDFVFVAAAGNYAVDASWGSEFTYISSPEVKDRIIVVGAAENNQYGSYSIADFSNYGGRLDVMAPGVQIFSAIPYNKYASWNGTSMATPHVTGVCAAVWAANPELHGNQIKDIIVGAADIPVTGNCPNMINMKAAMEEVIYTNGYPQASEEERQAAQLAYAEFLHAGVTLSKSKWGGECEADHYYLFDMNGDGLEEMIAYTSPRSLEWTFAVYTYANGQVTQIADSINTCDISEWSNAAITAEISNGVLHAYVGKANAAYEGGSDNYLFFNGKNVKNYRNGDGLPVPFGCAAFTLFKNDDDYGILIGSDQDFLSRLYYQKHPPATPAPEPTPAMGTDLIADGDYYAQLTSWDSDTMTIELLKLEGVCEWSDNLMLSNTGNFFTLDVSRATICLDAVWGSGEEIQCDSIDDALNTIVWGNTYLRDACSMQISITVRNSQVSKIVFLYRA